VLLINASGRLLRRKSFVIWLITALKKSKLSPLARGMASAMGASFSYPFAVERVQFVQNFYNYVCAAKPGKFTLTWSDWVTQTMTPKQAVASA
jgi:hypothetical protein